MRIWIILFSVVYAHIFGVLLNYENAWMHPEVADSTTIIFKDHATFQDRFSQCLNWQLLEGQYEGRPDSRPRFSSHIFQVSNILLRNWLWQYFPPHPSFSLTWLFALFLSLYFLYKLMINLTQDKNIARLTALLYLCLPGNLIPVIMLFHPSSPETPDFSPGRKAKKQGLRLRRIPPSRF